MKPKNKFQQHVVELSKRLPRITEPQQRWHISIALTTSASGTPKELSLVWSADIRGRVITAPLLILFWVVSVPVALPN